MSNDETIAGLLAQVIADPHDDFVRELLAEAYSERGDETRAAFIHAEISLASGKEFGQPLTKKRTGELKKESATLFKEHRAAWEEPLRKAGGRNINWKGGRGFPVSLSMDWSEFCNAASLLATYPPMKLIISDHYINDENSLNLSHNTLGDAGAQILANSKHFTHLTELRLLETGIGEPGMRALADSPNFPNLTDIVLQFDCARAFVARLASHRPANASEGTKAFPKLETINARPLASYAEFSQRADPRGNWAQRRGGQEPRGRG